MHHDEKSMGRALSRRQILKIAAAGSLGVAASIDPFGTATSATDTPSLSQSATAAQQAERLQPPQSHAPVWWPQLWRPGDLIRDGDPTGPKIVTITSDDGPWPRNTQTMMNHMRDAGLETDGGLIQFFMVANNLAAFPDVGREVLDRGYGIGNHSLTHATYRPAGIAAEISPAQDLFDSILGYRPRYFRSPGLTQGAVIQRELERLSMANVFTSVDLHDSAMPRISSQQIVANVARSLHPGYLMLIHDGGSHTNTVAALPAIIGAIRDHGYDIVRLDELLATGICQRTSIERERTRAEIAADEAALGSDEFADVVVELRTYLELSRRLSAARRQSIEQAIARARATQDTERPWADGHDGTPQ